MTQSGFITIAHMDVVQNTAIGVSGGFCAAALVTGILFSLADITVGVALVLR